MNDKDRNARAEALWEAYHLAFDVKDTLDGSAFGSPDERARYALYEAISKLDTAMRLLDVQVPERFDGTGRK